MRNIWVSCSCRRPGTFVHRVAHLTMSLYLYSCGSNARGVLRDFEGRRVSSKNPSRETRELLGGTQEKSISLTMGHWFALNRHINDLSKRAELKRLDSVTRPAAPFQTTRRMWAVGMLRHPDPSLSNTRKKLSGVNCSQSRVRRHFSDDVIKRGGYCSGMVS